MSFVSTFEHNLISDRMTMLVHVYHLQGPQSASCIEPLDNHHVHNNYKVYATPTTAKKGDLLGLGKL